MYHQRPDPRRPDQRAPYAPGEGAGAAEGQGPGPAPDGAQPQGRRRPRSPGHHQGQRRAPGPRRGRPLPARGGRPESRPGAAPPPPAMKTPAVPIACARRAGGTASERTAKAPGERGWPGPARGRLSSPSRRAWSPSRTAGDTRRRPDRRRGPAYAPAVQHEARPQIADQVRGVVAGDDQGHPRGLAPRERGGGATTGNWQNRSRKAREYHQPRLPHRVPHRGNPLRAGRSSAGRRPGTGATPKGRQSVGVQAKRGCGPRVAQGGGARRGPPADGGEAARDALQVAPEVLPTHPRLRRHQALLSHDVRCSGRGPGGHPGLADQDVVPSPVLHSQVAP